MDPRLYLAIDNCFASKRWTKPETWAKVISEMGIHYVECSADTECDPLYMGKQYIDRWIKQVQQACIDSAMHIANLYSGHGTYSTLGLTHWDSEVRNRFRDQWIKVQMDTAAALGAGLGFYTHAFDHEILQSGHLYEYKVQELYENLAEIAQYARTIGMKYIGVEQMYTPHQYPWTITGARDLLKHVYSLAGCPFYLTIDVGHMNGQQYFGKPDADEIRAAIHRVRRNQYPDIWLGTERAYDLLESTKWDNSGREKVVEEIVLEMDSNPHLFANDEDGDPFRWIEELGCYSPIIHLQQNDGRSSLHWPFDDAHNKKGIISGEKLLHYLSKSYQQVDDPAMPEKCDSIVLTLEPFIATAGNPYAELRTLRESAQYWRTFIPEDGIRLSQLTCIQ